MRAIDHAAKFYTDNGMDLVKDISYYMQFGEVVCTSDRFLLAKAARHDDPMAYCSLSDADAWFVHFAYGKNCLRRFVEEAPKKLPFLCWHRIKDCVENKSQRLHVIKTDRFLKFYGNQS